MKYRVLILTAFYCQCCFAQHWQSLQGGLERYTTKLYADTISNTLIVGGTFNQVNHQTQWGIASWNGNQWDSLGSGIDYSYVPFHPNNILGIARYGSCLYVGGTFKAAGGVPIPAFAQWNGTSWDTVPGGLMNDVLYDQVDDIQVYNNELYICGSFDSVGNTPANCIAKWDGTTWQAIGPNYPFTNDTIQSVIYKMEFYRGNLYVMGTFFGPTGNISRIAKWNGSMWTFFYNFASATFNDLQVYNDKLYVGGLFSLGAGKNGIMSWNDTTWSGVGGGTEIVFNPNPTVMDMCVSNGKLYCVGDFEMIGGIAAEGLASWDGTNWCGYGTTFIDNSQLVGAMNIAFYNDTMYVGGSFDTVDGDTMNCIAKWVGGNFVSGCGFISTGESELSAQRTSCTLFPNPISTTATFQFPGNPTSHTILIYDQLSREIWRKESDENNVEFSAETFPDGIYFYKIQTADGQIASGKFIVAH